MKSKSLLLCFILLSLAGLAQQTEGVPEVVQAIKLSKDEAAKFSTSNAEAFQIESGEIMRARKGWEIFIDEQAKAFVFRKTGTKTRAENAAGLQFAEIYDASFRTFCFCPSKSSGNCKITIESIGNDQHYRCEGNCECDSFSIFEPETSPREVLHPTMGWQQFPLW